MRDIRDIKAAVVGTGFIGVVHVEALRRLGIEVAGVVGSTPERAPSKRARPGLPARVRELRGDARRPGGRRRAPHDAEPPALRAGQGGAARPASTSSARSRWRWTRPRPPSWSRSPSASGLVHASNFNVRFYPQCQEARARVVAAGDLGDVCDVHGGYLQDWLLFDTDWNWRLEPERGRRAAGGRRHRLALARPRPVRHRPPRRGGDGRPHDRSSTCASSRPAPVETFAGAGGGRDVEPVAMDDRGRRAASCCASSGGARGSCVGLPGVSAGRKNRLRFEVDGSDERAGRGSPSRPRSSGSATATGPTSCSVRERRAPYPPGHAEGFPDTFKALYRSGLRAPSRRASPGDGLPDVRRRPRRGRDRRCHRPVARRAAMGRR